MKGVSTTVHADKRARQRIGTKNTSKIFEDALEYGIKASELKGQFKKYIDKISMKHKSTPVIYKGNIFCHRKGLLITVIPLHQKWNKYIKKERKENETI